MIESGDIAGYVCRFPRKPLKIHGYTLDIFEATSGIYTRPAQARSGLDQRSAELAPARF